MPAEFLCNLPKNLTTHLTHKLYSVFPYEFYYAYFSPDFHFYAKGRGFFG